MRLLFVFAPAFLEWPLAMVRQIQKTLPDASFAGLVTGGKDVFQRVTQQTEPSLTPLYSLAELEEQWLNTDIDADALEQLDARYEPGFLQRIVVADRKIGYGFVSGGVIPPCPLVEQSRDQEAVRRYIFGMMTFLESLLIDEKIDRVFCYTVAGAYSLALKELCRFMGKSFYLLEHTRIGTRYVLDDESETILGPVARLFDEALQNSDCVKETIPEAEAYLREFRNRPALPEYSDFCKDSLIKTKSWSGIFQQLYRDFYGVVSATIKRPKPELGKTREWDLLVYNLRMGLRQRRHARLPAFKTFDQLPKRPFVYYPLHVDPEASTMVLAPMHVNQLQVIESIARSVPLSWNVFVKEHIPMIGKRPADFYERLQRIPGVYLVSPMENNFALIQKAKAICTITGTVGWEAMLLQRPVVVMGNTPYLALRQGYVHCPDLTRLPIAIQEALRVSSVEDRRLVLYLAALFQLTFDCPTELFWGRVTRETVTANYGIVDAMCERLLASAQTGKSILNPPIFRSE